MEKFKTLWGNLDKRKRLMLLMIMASITFLLSTISYAFFSAFVDDANEFGADLSAANLALTFEDGDNGVDAELGFGESTTKKFKITNTGTKQASLSLDWFQLLNTYGNEALSFELIETTPEGTKTKIVNGNIPTSSERLTQTLAGELSVEAGKTNTYDLVITLNDLPNIDKTTYVDAVLNTRFSVDQPQRYRYFTLKVDPNGGKWDESTNAKEFLLKTGEQKAGITNPTRTGYTFKGWEVIGPSSILEDNTFTMGISYTTLKAKWNANEYDLTVDLDGGNQTNTPTKAKYETPLELEVPEKRGHKFREWQTSDGEVVGNKFTLTSLKAATIKAIYDPIEYNYTILYKTQNIGGSGYTEIDGTKVTGKLAYGETIPSTVPDYTGFTTPAKVTNKKITDNDSENVITYEYTRNKYILTIKPNTGTYDGSTIDKTIENVYYEQEVTISKPVKDGYTFTGWTNDGSGTLSTTGDVDKYKMGAGNSILTANYEVSTFKYIVYHEKQNIDNNEYTRTADIDKGSAKINSTVTTSPKNYGLGFTSLEPTGGRGLTIASDIAFDAEGDPTKNVKTYKYNRNSFNLTLDLDGGTLSDVTSPISLKHEKTYTLGTPTKEGHTFDKWTKIAGDDSTLDGSTFKMGTTNATVKATYTVNSYKYIIQHKTMNTDGVNYTVRETETEPEPAVPDQVIEPYHANYGTSVSGRPKAYLGFKDGVCNSLTIGANEASNIVVCTYEREKATVTLSYPDSGVTVTDKGSFPNGTNGDTLTDYYQKKVTLPTLTRTGYTFAWTPISGIGVGGISGSQYIMGSINVTVTGTWTANTYSITYNANGGKWSDDTVLKSVNNVYDSVYKLPSSDPTRAVNGYTFAGWYTKAIGGEKVTVSTKLTKAENHTLYAHWTNAFTSDVESTLTALGLKTTSGYSDYIKTTSPTPTEFAAGVQSNTEGMYTMEDDYGTSYYYRGAATKNYVKFGTNSEGKDMWWRIIRINGDGSIRMIYDGTQGYANRNGAETYQTNYQNRFIEPPGSEGMDLYFGLQFNNYTDDAKYVGYKYGGVAGEASTSKQQAERKDTDSTIKKVVEEWYDANLKEENKYLADGTFCIDRSISENPNEWTPEWFEEPVLDGSQDLRGYGQSNTAYGAYGRFDGNTKTNIPQFICPRESDKFTVSNGGLGKKIGLITADEIVAAGASTSGTSYYHYLNKSSSAEYFTLSPYNYDYDDEMASVFTISISGNLYNEYVDTDGEVAPVINLSAEHAKTLVGKGTMDSPYQLPIDATLTALGLKTTSGNSDYIKTTNPTSEEFNAGVTSNTEGMYTMEDDYGTSYYYRGAVTKNYVKFGQNTSNQYMYWRIIRINGDGSLRMIYDGTKAYENRNGAETYQENNTDRFIKTNVPWEASYDPSYNANTDVKHLGYMFGANMPSTKRNGNDSSAATYNEVNSTIKSELEAWYDANLKEEEKYLADSAFCNDRSISSTPSKREPALENGVDIRGYDMNTTEFGAFIRIGLENEIVNPSFVCPQSNDMFTVKEQKINGKTTNRKGGRKIGLITADEAVAAGATPGYGSNLYNYLNRSHDFWTMTPMYFHNPLQSSYNFYAPDQYDVRAYLYTLTSDGTVGASNGGMQYAHNVAPVINISAEYARQLDGTGIIGDEYRLPNSLPDELYAPLQPEEEKDTEDPLGGLTPP